MPRRPLGADRSAGTVPALQEWIVPMSADGRQRCCGLRPLRVKMRELLTPRHRGRGVARQRSASPPARRAGRREKIAFPGDRQRYRQGMRGGRRPPWPAVPQQPVQPRRRCSAPLAGANRGSAPRHRGQTSVRLAFDSLTQFASLTRLEPPPRLDSLPHLDPRPHLDSLTQFDLLALPPLGSPRQLASPPNPHPPPRSSASRLAAGVGPAAALARGIIRARLAASRLRSADRGPAAPPATPLQPSDRQPLHGQRFAAAVRFIAPYPPLLLSGWAWRGLPRARATQSCLARPPSALATYDCS
jgi:hypothetical protein